MMKTEPKAEAFEECLKQIRSGASLDEVLRRYPQWADELLPMLRAADAAERVGAEIHVPKAALARSRARFLRAALRRPQPRPQSRPFSFTPLRFGLVALVLLFGLIFLGGTTFVASAQALPGDALYPVKIFTEQTRLRLTNNPAQRLELEQTFDHERVVEVDALIQRSRTLSVNFVGALNDMQSNELRVGDVRVLLTPQTQIKGEIQPGYFVGVQGILQPDGTVIAAQVWDREYQFTGRLNAFSSDQLTVGNISVSVSPLTQINGSPEIGSQVSVSAALLVNGGLQAHLIKVIAPPRSAPRVAASRTPYPTNINQPSRTLETEPTQEPGHTLEPTEAGDQGDSSGNTVKPSRTPEPTEKGDDREIRPTRTSQPTEGDDNHQGRPTQTPKPTESDDYGEHHSTPTQTSQPTQTPQPGSTIQPTATPEPSPTPKPTEHHDD